MASSTTTLSTDAAIRLDATTLERLIERSFDGVLILDLAGTILHCNASAERMLGRSSERLVGSSFGRPIGANTTLELNLGPGYESRQATVAVTSIRWHGRPAMLATISDDVSVRTAFSLREFNHTLSTVISLAPVGIIRVAPDGTVLSWNDAAERILGRSAAEVIGINSAELGLDLTVASDQRLSRSDGTEAVVSVSISDINADDPLVGAVAVITDATERYAREDEMRRMALHDPLTGALNRRAFELTVQRAVENLRAHPKLFGGAILMLDLDRFKALNDAAGHLAGDQMLIGIARQLKHALRADEALARLGGDEFAVVLDGADREEALDCAQRIRALVAGFSLTVHGTRFETSATIGGALLDGSLDAHEAIAVADLALGDAKRDGRSPILLYESAVDKAIQLARAASRARRIRRAVDADEFAVKLEGLISLDSDRRVGVEALIRLPQAGRLVAPGQFLPLAESMGMMLEIDTWMLRQAMRMVADPDHAPVWINLAPSSIGQLQIASLLRDLPSWQSERIGFEISERTVPEELGLVAAWIGRVRAAGCKVALDDFGAAASSFGFLRDLPVDMVKIDAQLAQQLGTDKTDRRVVAAVVDIAHSLDVSVAIEGIESTQAAGAARELGVDLAQGFLWDPDGDV